MITTDLTFEREKNDLWTWLIIAKQSTNYLGKGFSSLSLSLSLSLYIYIYMIITIKKKFWSTLKFFVIARGYRLLPNLVILSVLCIFFFWFIFFVSIVCLEIFLWSKIFSQSILIIFELPLFYIWTHLSWLVQNFQEKKGVWRLIPFCFIWFLQLKRHSCIKKLCMYTSNYYFLG